MTFIVMTFYCYCPLKQKPHLLEIYPTESVPFHQTAVVSPVQVATLFLCFLDLFQKEHHQEPQLQRILELKF